MTNDQFPSNFAIVGVEFLKSCMFIPKRDMLLCFADMVWVIRYRVLGA